MRLHARDVIRDIHGANAFPILFIAVSPMTRVGLAARAMAGTILMVNAPSASPKARTEHAAIVTT
jgi:hypothetical protein